MKLIKYSKYLVVLIISVTFFLCGCKENVQSKLIGTWELVSFSSDKSGVTFNFKDGDAVIREYTLPNGTIAKDTGFYYMESGFPSKKIKFYKFKSITANNVVYDDLDGKWWIEDLKGNILTMTRIEKPDLTAPYLRLEFIKK